MIQIKSERVAGQKVPSTQQMYYIHLTEDVSDIIYFSSHSERENRQFFYTQKSTFTIQSEESSINLFLRYGHTHQSFQLVCLSKRTIFLI